MSDRRRCELDLLVTELVTNAIVHAGTDVHVALHLDEGLIFVAVRDFGIGSPVLRSGADIAEHDAGWGLRLLAGLAIRWGVLPADPGKVVGFELSPR